MVIMTIKGNLYREMETVKKNQMNVLELRSVIFEMKNSLDGQWELPDMNNSKNKDFKTMDRGSMDYGAMSDSLIYMKLESEKKLNVSERKYLKR